MGSLAHVDVKYNSPGVKGRTGKIWVIWFRGYGKKQHWQCCGNSLEAGANENTVITLSHNMLINGKAIPAGSYGFHIIPQKTCLGCSFSTKPIPPGAVILTMPKTMLWGLKWVRWVPHLAEWFTYEFTNRKPESTTLQLRWENLAIPMEISLPNGNDLYLAKFREDLKEREQRLYWQNYIEAVNFCVNNNTNLEQSADLGRSGHIGDICRSEKFHYPIR